jgi:hypothetical protein
LRVTLKKNRSAETVALIFGVPAPLDARCSRKPRTSSDLAVSGQTPQSQDRTPRHAISLAAPAAASDLPRERFNPMAQSGHCRI